MSYHAQFSRISFRVFMLKANNIVFRVKLNKICFTKNFSSTGLYSQKINSTQNVGFERDFSCLKKPFLFTILVR